VTHDGAARAPFDCRERAGARRDDESAEKLLKKKLPEKTEKKIWEFDFILA
jgi:hypothetical protein